MAKKIIITEAMFDRTRNYIDQRYSRIMTSVTMMKEKADQFIATIKHEFGMQYPQQCDIIEEVVRDLVEYIEFTATNI